jgi:hypothetical protein
MTVLSRSFKRGSHKAKITASWSVGLVGRRTLLMYLLCTYVRVCRSFHSLLFMRARVMYAVSALYHSTPLPKHVVRECRAYAAC